MSDRMSKSVSDKAGSRMSDKAGVEDTFHTADIVSSVKSYLLEHPAKYCGKVESLLFFCRKHLGFSTFGFPDEQV